MQREVLVYGSIGGYSAKEFIESINKIKLEDPKAELTARLNTNGGDVDYGWGMVSKFAEYPNRKTVIVDGKAQSMGLYFCCYASEVIAADFSTFLLHRASYWGESYPEYFTDDIKRSLAQCNKKLREALEAKIDVKKFERITGATLDDVFSMEGVLDIELTAQEAKKIGLVQKIIQVTPQAQAAIEAKTIEITAMANGLKMVAKSTDNPNPQKTHTAMTIAELKAEHPGLIAEIIESEVKQALKKDRRRILALNKFHDLDAKAIDAKIENGEELDMADVVDFMEKRQAKKAVKSAEEDSVEDPLTTDEPASKEKGKEAKALDEFKASVLANSTELGGQKAAKA